MDELDGKLMNLAINFDTETSDKVETDIKMDEMRGEENSTFETLTTAQIEKKMCQYIDGVIDAVKSMVTVSDSVVRTLLIYVNWDKQALIRLMTDKDLDTFIAIANDANPFPHNANPFTNDYDQMVNSFVQHNDSLRWCPVWGCTLAIQANSSLRMNYKQDCMCTSGHRFCFNCGDEWHNPLPCGLISNWKKNGHEKIAMHQAANVKKCPKCSEFVAKDPTRFNFMKCGFCKQQFCWNCKNEWDDPEYHRCFYDVKRMENGVENGEKYRFYMTCYKLNKFSLEEEQKLVDSDSIKDQIQKWVNEGVPVRHSQFLAKAVGTLFESRKKLLFTYIFAYFVKPHTQKEIFEKNQKDFQSATDELSNNLKHEITNVTAKDIVVKVSDNVHYCEYCQKILEDHIFEGLEKNWWSFASYAIDLIPLKLQRSN